MKVIITTDDGEVLETMDSRTIETFGDEVIVYDRNSFASMVAEAVCNEWKALEARGKKP